MSPTYQIRPLIAEDEALLREMLVHALYVPAGQAAFPPEIVNQPGIRKYVQGWGRAGDLGLAAQVDGRAAGAAWLRLFSAAQPGYGFVADDIPELSIALLPAYRGRGIGSALLSRLFEIAAVDYTSISLSVSAENPARRLYQRLGFETVRLDGDALVMLKYLKHGS